MIVFVLTVLAPYLTHCHSWTRAISAVAASSCSGVSEGKLGCLIAMRLTMR